MSSALNIFNNRKADFVASIEIYPCGTKTRTHPPFNGIRWSFIFAEDVENLGLGDAMRQLIFPEFIDGDGNTIADKVSLIGKLNAKMHVVAISDGAPAVKVGTQFYCAEGARIMAKGTVTSLII